jgi:S-adenosylmethionine:tRNA ribosyltransferase-isomerase
MGKLQDKIPPLESSYYTYELPSHRIAREPLAERDASRLLVADVPVRSIRHLGFRDLPSLLPAKGLLVVNNSRVIAARLAMHKPTGGAVEVLLDHPLAPSADPAIVLRSQEPSRWNAMIGGRHVTVGMVLTCTSGLRAYVVERNGLHSTVELQWDDAVPLATMLDRAGEVPLPPYMNRVPVAADKERYQTVYAEEDGSVAAPTAGLHFTPRVLQELEDRGVQRADVTLHVGMGTFLPVSAADARDHDMHAERFSVRLTTIDALCEQSERADGWITAVGTTSLRTLESLLCFGSALARGEQRERCLIDQWDAYRRDESVTRAVAFNAVRTWMRERSMEEIVGDTSIMIAPGVRVGSIDALITNFHQPGSTLLLLVAAIAGEPFWRTIYEEALREDYRFLSYGDSSLIRVAATRDTSV